MKISGIMSGNNNLLNSVMSQQGAVEGDSYAELAMHGRKVGTNLQRQEMGKASVGELKIKAKEDAEDIDEAIAKATAKKQEADKIEAQRIAQKQATSTTATPAPSTGDTVTISPEGQEAAKNVTVVTTPAPAQPALQVTPTAVTPAQVAPAQVAPAQQASAQSSAPQAAST